MKKHKTRVSPQKRTSRKPTQAIDPFSEYKYLQLLLKFSQRAVDEQPSLEPAFRSQIQRLQAQIDSLPTKNKPKNTKKGRGGRSCE